jgi:amino acid transporter
MIWGVRSDFAYLFSIHADLSKWTVCSIFLSIIALAMAELGSAAPTSGGLYYWTFMFSSPRWRCLLSWIVGCKFFHIDHWSYTLIFNWRRFEHRG